MSIYHSFRTSQTRTIFSHSRFIHFLARSAQDTCICIHCIRFVVILTSILPEPSRMTTPKQQLSSSEKGCHLTQPCCILYHRTLSYHIMVRTLSLSLAWRAGYPETITPLPHFGISSSMAGVPETSRRAQGSISKVISMDRGNQGRCAHREACSWRILTRKISMLDSSLFPRRMQFQWILNSANF